MDELTKEPSIDADVRVVPGHISDIGDDDIELTSYMTRSLIALRQPAFNFGLQSAKLLTSHLQKQQSPPSETVRDTQLIIRESVGERPAGTG